MLSQKLLSIFVLGIEPVLWVLVFMSVMTFGIIIERLFAFSTLSKDAASQNEKELTLLLEKRLGILATFGSNAPFVGLFGTVLGIIQAFHTLSYTSEFTVGTIMGGISEALVATAAGLFVAVPSIAAYNYFIRRIRTILLSR